MNLYSRARKHIDMSRVKELRTRFIEQQEIEKIKFQEEQIILASKELEKFQDSRYSNWKREISGESIEEGMTTSGMFQINLPPEIPTAEDDINTHQDPNLPPDGTLSNGAWTMNDQPPEGSAGVNITMLADLTRTDTLSFQIYFSGATVEEMSLVIDGPPGSGLQKVIPINVPGSGTGSDGRQITIDKSLRVKNAYVTYSAIGVKDENNVRHVGNNAILITSTVPYRRFPMNVFASLDDPEATAFIRDALSSDGLSPAEKKKKLEQMLGASAEYVTKMFGEGAFTGASEISDVQVQQSFAQIAQGLPYVDEDDAFDDDYYQGPVPDYMDDSDVDLPIELANAGPSTPVKTDSDGRIVPNQGGGRPGKVRLKPGMLPRAGRRQPQYAHYEPEGEVIVEKKLKSPKSLLDKIPGYYDGKPAPLGFPIEEPPKLKNGMHPDLVDGKKVANRYNRLDPISAKSMPKTGNKYIDAKVAKARKKAK